MSKKRTREQKQNAKHNFSLSWSPEAHVKRQNTIALKAKNSSIEAKESAHLLAKESVIEATKKNLFRSLIIVSFILCLELVVYLAWK